MVGSKIISVELGGTFLRVGVVKNRRILKYLKELTPKKPEELVELLFGMIGSLISKDVKGIGIASPGPLKGGVVLNPPNLCLRNFDLKRAVVKRFGKKVEIENDSNCVALAESKVGVGKSKKNFIVLTLGTGIGGGIIIDSKLYRGKGFAGEFGHLVLDRGKYFEDLAGWKRIRKLTLKEFGEEVWVTDLVKMNNRKSKKILEELSNYLGQGIGSLVNLFDPEVVVLAGGMRKSGEKFLKMIKKQTENYVLFDRKLDVRWSRLNHPGILGASFLV